MKNLCVMTAIVCLALLGYSCQKDELEPIGYGTPTKFTPKNNKLGYKVQETTLISKNNVKWWLSSLEIDGKDINLGETSKGIEITHNKTNVYETIKLQGEWFTWEKVDNTHIKIILKKNNDKKRTLEFTTQAGNAFQTITVIQEARQ